MTMRVSNTTVTFRKPFFIGGSDEILPAGVYRVESRNWFQSGKFLCDLLRPSALLELHLKPDCPGSAQILTISRSKLEATLECDHSPAAIPGEPDLDELMLEPIVRLVMRSDGLSESDVRGVIEMARETVRSGPKHRTLGTG